MRVPRKKLGAAGTPRRKGVPKEEVCVVIMGEGALVFILLHPPRLLLLRGEAILAQQHTLGMRRQKTRTTKSRHHLTMNSTMQNQAKPPNPSLGVPRRLTRVPASPWGPRG